MFLARISERIRILTRFPAERLGRCRPTRFRRRRRRGPRFDGALRRGPPWDPHGSVSFLLFSIEWRKRRWEKQPWVKKGSNNEIIIITRTEWRKKELRSVKCVPSYATWICHVADCYWMVTRHHASYWIGQRVLRFHHFSGILLVMSVHTCWFFRQFAFFFTRIFCDFSYTFFLLPVL